MAGEGDGQTFAEFDVRAGLRGLLSDLKEIDPKLATALRRRLRRAGDGAITAMGQLLDEYEGGTVTGHTYRRGRDSRGRRRRLIDSDLTASAGRSRSRGSREAVKVGLRMRVTAGQRRTTIRLTSTSGALRMALNARRWRHPVFGTERYVTQPGNQYFNRGVESERDRLRDEIYDAIRDALADLDGKSYHVGAV